MPVEIVMPRLSDTMSEGTVGRWLKREGEEVKRGESLAEIETDKAVMDLECFYDGAMGRILVPEGTTVPVGTLIAIILAPGEELPAARDTASARPPESVPPAPHQAPPVPAPATVAPTAPEGERVRATPRARRRAEELGVDLSQVEGSGTSGRITEEDVTAFAQSAAPVGAPRPVTEETAAPQVAPSPPASEEEVEIIQPSRMQAAIARRTLESTTTIPFFFVTSLIDMGEAARLRSSINASLEGEGSISFNDMVLKAVALALAKFPEVNSSWQDGKIIRHRQIHLGTAVGMPGALVVPVIRDCDRKSLKEIAKEGRELIERARAGRLTLAEMEGSTFSVSNLGMFDVEQFTAIINQPNSAVLAVGAIKPMPAVIEGEVKVAQMMKVTMTCDHRTVYGLDAARFLQELKSVLEHPLKLLL